MNARFPHLGLLSVALLVVELGLYAAHVLRVLRVAMLVARFFLSPGKREQHVRRVCRETAGGAVPVKPVLMLQRSSIRDRVLATTCTKSRSTCTTVPG